MPSIFEIGKFRGRFLKGFTIYGHGSHFGHVIWFINLHIGSSFLYMLHIKFGFDWPSGFREDV